MRATLDASWEMLSRDEREVLAQASVFAAPFGIEAAEEIVQLPSPGRPDGAVEVLDVVESLLRKSLLRDGRYLDQALYAIVDADWRVLRQQQVRALPVH